MRSRRVMCLRLAPLAACLVSITFAATAAQSVAPKAQTATHTPDLSGVWNKAAANTPGSARNMMESPSMTPWAEAKYKAAKAAQDDPSGKGELTDPVFACFPPGVPRIYDQAAPFEIIQIPGRVLMFFEYEHFVRQIWMNRAQHDKDLPPTWMGDSIGRWEGDTLVIDTIGFNDATMLDNMNHPHSDALHLLERIRRVDHDTLEDDLTFDDPKAYTKTWERRQVYQLKPDWHIMERVCVDNLTFNDFFNKAIEPGK